MRVRRFHPVIATGAALVLLASNAARAQDDRVPGSARISLFTDAASTTASDTGTSSQTTQVITTVAVQSPTSESNGVEYGLDVRAAAHPSGQGRTSRFSLYDGYVGDRIADGRLGIKAGQLWINELGGLGAVGGVLVEGRQHRRSGAGRLRVGIFAGVEPQVMELTYASGVRKTGGYVAYDGQGAWRDVAGLVTIRNHGLTERTVLVTNNFLPVNKQVFVYQASEFDLVGPAGQGSGGLNYWFTNARVSPSQRVDLQLTYHRGRSIDVRSITNDQLSGRPIDPKSLDGLLFESVGGRVTATVATGVRLIGGYWHDRTNQDDVATGRLTIGVWLSNIRKSGIDFTVTDARTLRGSASYDALYASIGRTFAGRLYASADVTTSYSVLAVVNGSQISVQTRPRTTRLSGSVTANVSRAISLLIIAERTNDSSFRDNRILAGLAWRATMK